MTLLLLQLYRDAAFLEIICAVVNGLESPARSKSRPLKGNTSILERLKNCPALGEDSHFLDDATLTLGLCNGMTKCCHHSKELRVGGLSSVLAIIVAFFFPLSFSLLFRLAPSHSRTQKTPACLEVLSAPVCPESKCLSSEDVFTSARLGFVNVFKDDLACLQAVLANLFVHDAENAFEGLRLEGVAVVGRHFGFLFTHNRN
jgi:hypothetical protein